MNIVNRRFGFFAAKIIVEKGGCFMAKKHAYIAEQTKFILRMNPRFDMEEDGSDLKYEFEGRKYAHRLIETNLGETDGVKILYDDVSMDWDQFIPDKDHVAACIPSMEFFTQREAMGGDAPEDRLFIAEFAMVFHEGTLFYLKTVQDPSLNPMIDKLTFMDMEGQKEDIVLTAAKLGLTAVGIESVFDQDPSKAYTKLYWTA